MLANELDKLFPTVEFSTEVEIKPLPWAVENLWQRGKINVVFGAEKAGKSRFLNWVLMHCFSKEVETVFEERVTWRPKRLLYLAGEEPTDEVNARMLRYYSMLNQGAVDELPIEFISASGMQLNQPQYRQWLEQKLVEGEFDSLVIDPLRRVHDGDESDNSEMARIFNALRRWTNKLGITMVLLHHTGKLSDDADLDRIATWGRGATDLAAILDTAAFVRRIDGGSVQVLRAGRFPPVPALKLADGQDKSFAFKRVK